MRRAPDLRTRAVLTLALGAVLALALSGCTSAPAASALVQSFPVAQRKPAPVLSGPLLTGTGTVDMAGYAGDVVVVNFWASWCGPCRQEAPGLSKVARQYGGKVQFLGVDLKDTKPAAQVTVRDFGYPYPSVADPQGSIQRSFGFFAQPVTLFYDRNGDLVKVNQPGAGEVDHFSGPIPESTLRATVAKLAAPS